MTSKLLFAAILLILSNIVTSDKEELRLYEYLLDSEEQDTRANILERPVQNSSEKVTVFLGVILQQLINIDEKNQIVTLNAWLKYTWVDYKMRWRPEEFDGLTDIRLPSVNYIWKPDVLLYNSVDANFDSTYPTNMVVYSDGTINWIPPGIFKISCKIDITWFPFDDQRCFFKFGSWTYDGTKMDLQPDEKGLDMSDYLNNGQWLIKETTVTRKEKFYACCPEPYPDLKFILHLRRRTLYYGFNLIIPCLLITLMTLLGFMLPPDAGEKVSLQITVMLAICVFLNIVSDMTPPTSEAVPLLGTFFSCSMILVAVSVVFTVLVLNFHFRTSETHIMGKNTRAILLHWIPWMLFMKRPGKSIKRAELPTFLNFPKKEKEQTENSDNYTTMEKRIKKCLKMFSAQKSTELTTESQAKLLILERIFAQLKFITKRMSDEDEEKELESDWKFAAQVIDRLCLLIFSASIGGSTLIILFSAPYLV